MKRVTRRPGAGDPANFPRLQNGGIPVFQPFERYSPFERFSLFWPFQPF
ncbi:MAG: hypothetical protein VCB42_11140 [Myxococcota bacterium]